ncbi:MAG: tetratricopeptide repeat protein [Pseudomonadota bacterium]
MTTPQIIAYRPDRLGARVNALVNAIRISQELELPFSMWWTRSQIGSDGAEINDPLIMFSKEFVDQRFLDRDDWKELRKKSISVGPCQGMALPALKKKILNSGKNLLVDQAFGLSCFKGESEKAIAKQCGDIFDKLPLNPELDAERARLRDLLKETTAYHIRRGDLTDGKRTKHCAWMNKVDPDEYYNAHIVEQSQNDRKCILFSDSDEVIKKFSSKHASIETAKDLINAEGLHKGSIDFVELYAMSRCDPIIAPEHSAFSSSAADMGGSQKISVTDDITTDQRYQALVNLENRVLSDPDSFENEGEIGQMLLHLDSWYFERGEQEKSISLISKFVRNGMSLAHIYYLLVKRQVESGDYSGAIETGDMMDSHTLPHKKNLAASYACISLAQWMIGNEAAAVKEITRAVEMAGYSSEVQNVLSALFMAGVLTAENFVPLFPEIFNRASRKLDNKVGGDREIKSVIIKKLNETIGSADRLTIADGILLELMPVFGTNTGAKLRSKKRTGKYFNDPEPQGLDCQGFLLLEKYHIEGDEALADALIKMAEKNPRNHYLRYQVARMYYSKRDWKLAWNWTDKLREMAPERPAYSGIRGLLAMRMQDYEEAIASLKAATKGLPGSSFMQSSLATAYFKNGDLNGAIQAAESAAILDPINGYYGHQLAVYLLKDGQPKRALDSLNRLFDNGIANQKIIVTRCQALGELEDKTVLKVALADALEEFPDNEILKAMLKKIGPLHLS